MLDEKYHFTIKNINQPQPPILFIQKLWGKKRKETVWHYASNKQKHKSCSSDYVI